MRGGVAEQEVPGHGPLEEEVEVVLPREADAAVELEPVPGEELLALARRRLAIAVAVARRSSSSAIVSAANQARADARSTAR